MQYIEHQCCVASDQLRSPAAGSLAYFLSLTLQDNSHCRLVTDTQTMARLLPAVLRHPTCLCLVV